VSSLAVPVPVIVGGFWFLSSLADVRIGGRGGGCLSGFDVSSRAAGVIVGGSWFLSSLADVRISSRGAELCTMTARPAGIFHAQTGGGHV